MALDLYTVQSATQRGKDYSKSTIATVQRPLRRRRFLRSTMPGPFTAKSAWGVLLQAAKGSRVTLYASFSPPTPSPGCRTTAFTMTAAQVAVEINRYGERWGARAVVDPDGYICVYGAVMGRRRKQHQKYTPVVIEWSHRTASGAAAVPAKIVQAPAEYLRCETCGCADRSACWCNRAESEIAEHRKESATSWGETHWPWFAIAVYAVFCWMTGG